MLVSLDLETTGFDSTRDKIIEFGAIKFDPADPVNPQKQQTLQFLINPGFPLPSIITHITKIRDSALKDAPKIENRLSDVRDFIGNCPIIGHNIQFDIGFLRSAGLTVENDQYDTQQMSSIIIPGLTSYSLEILSEIFHLTHKEKHRALDDAIAAMELFIKVAEKFSKLPPDLLEKIQILAQKSAWPLKNFLKTIQPNPQTKKRTANKISAKSTPKNPTIKTPNFERILTESAPAMHEIQPPYDNLTALLSSKAPANTYVAIPHHLFENIHAKIPPSAAKIDIPENYISPARLDEFSQKKFFEEHEIIALLKYLVWLPQTETGLLHEINLFNKEKNTLATVNIQNPQNEPFFQKALQKDTNSPAVVTHRYIIENPPPQHCKIIIVSFEKFLKTLHYHNSIYLKPSLAIEPLQQLQEIEPENRTIPALIAKTTILFGIIGLIFKNKNDRSEYIARSHTDIETLSTADWIKAKDTVRNLIEASRELGGINNSRTFPFLKIWKKILTDLHKVFFDPALENNLIWIEENIEEEPVVKKIPVSTKNTLHNFLENFENYQIIDEELEILDEGKFVKNLNGLREDLPLLKYTAKNENLNISLLKKEYDKDQLANAIIEYIGKQKKNTAFIFNSKKELEFFTIKFSSANVPVISQLTASLGKLQEQLNTALESAQPVTILLTPNFWQNMDHHDKIDTAIIHKIPFDPPSDPLLTALSRNYVDPFNELQIPRAIISLKKIINSLSENNTKEKTALILDARILNRNYGHIIYKNLESIGFVNAITIKEL
ncbi:hypothetical protein HYW82_04545 [Candidatus Peregrinibacteria bacterium]|nr:hypothetical protein [Candidatus Peregrinibacteria bacterium]